MYQQAPASYQAEGKPIRETLSRLEVLTESARKGDLAYVTAPVNGRTPLR